MLAPMVLLWIAQTSPKLGELTEAQSMFIAALLTLECPTQDQ
jgi:hypothetical protein